MGQMHIFAYFLHISAFFFAYFCIFMLMHILAYNAYQDIYLAYNAYFRNAYLCIFSFAYFYIFCAYICTYLSLTSMIFLLFCIFMYVVLLLRRSGFLVFLIHSSALRKTRSRVEGQKGSRLCRVQKRLRYALQRESALCHRSPASSGRSSARAQQRKKSLEALDLLDAYSSSRWFCTSGTLVHPNSYMNS